MVLALFGFDALAPRKPIIIINNCAEKYCVEIDRKGHISDSVAYVSWPAVGSD